MKKYFSWFCEDACLCFLNKKQEQNLLFLHSGFGGVSNGNYSNFSEQHYVVWTFSTRWKDIDSVWQSWYLLAAVSSPISSNITKWINICKVLRNVSGPLQALHAIYPSKQVAW